MGTFNYFNYFTEVEEHFWQKRGAHLLVSPLDWAIVETWQKSGIPLEAVLKGIDRAFESYARSRRGASGRPLKSLAYCTDAVLDAASEVSEASAGANPHGTSALQRVEPFPREELRAFFKKNAQQLRAGATQQNSVHPDLAKMLSDTANSVEELLALLDSPARLDLEDLERRLTVLEEKLNAAATISASEEAMLDIRREMERSLAPYRRKMTVEQLSQLERRFQQKRLYELFRIPRLSLFYLG
ncbi:MAG: hypothetical protein ACRD50_06620 [Candidatus Acidiferrales bacterium]